MLEAETPMGASDLGISRSNWYMCDDGDVYLIKCNYPESNDRVVLNELIGARLARMAGLQVPDTKLVHISDKVIAPNAEGILPGIQIAVKREDIVKHAESVNRQPRLLIPWSTLFSEIQNGKDLGPIFVFDLWIANGDRAGNIGNWIIVIRDGKRYVNVIDHGHAFVGPNSHRILQPTEKFDLNSLNNIYAVLMDAIPNTCKQNPFIDIVPRIESLTRDDIGSLFNEVPTEWNIPTEELSQMRDFIYLRAQNLRANITRIIDVEKRHPDIGKEGLVWNK